MVTTVAVLLDEYPSGSLRKTVAVLVSVTLELVGIITMEISAFVAPGSLVSGSGVVLTVLHAGQSFSWR